MRGRARHCFVSHRVLPTAMRCRFLFREIQSSRAFLSKAQLYELRKVKVPCDAKRHRVSVSVDRQRNEFLTRHLNVTARYDFLRYHDLEYVFDLFNLLFINSSYAFESKWKLRNQSRIYTYTKLYVKM